MLNFHTGQPFDEVLPLGNPALPFDPATQYMRLVSDPFAGISHTFSAANGGEVWVNPAAFCDPTVTATCSGKPFGRNKFHGPGYGAVDLSVLKTIPIRERIKVQLRAEMFNLLNRINLASGSGAVSSYSSGLVSDTIGDFNGAPGIGPGEAFNMQLVAKIIF